MPHSSVHEEAWSVFDTLLARGLNPSYTERITAEKDLLRTLIEREGEFQRFQFLTRALADLGGAVDG